MNRWCAVWLFGMLVLSVAACSPSAAPGTPMEGPALVATATMAKPTETGVIQPDPALSATPADILVGVDDLPIGQPGHYVNLAFGFWTRYPETWYTGFGNRPLLASFSNLDPGTHNRHSMRSKGCLVEVNVATNVFGLSPQQVAGQLFRGLPGSSAIHLGGSRAVRVVRTSHEDDGFISELILAEHEGRLFSLTLEYTKAADESCASGWEQMIESWRWLDPDLIAYRNPTYGYGLSYPRGWHAFDPRAEGISLSSSEPTGQPEAEFLKDNMLVRTSVFENAEHLTIKGWLSAQDWDVSLAGEIPANGLLGVRMLREGPAAGIQEVTGYFQGPLGRFYAVSCLYHEDRAEEFETIADAIIFSFSF